MDNQFKAIFEKLPDAIILINVDGAEISGVNSSALNLLKFKREDLVGSQPEILFKDESVLAEIRNSTFSSSESIEFTTELISKNNKPCSVRLSCSALKLENNEIIQIVVYPIAIDSGTTDQKSDNKLKLSFNKRSRNSVTPAENDQKSAANITVGIYCSGFVMAAALRELFDKTIINVKYHTYPGEFDLRSKTLAKYDFLIFASPRISKDEVNDLLDLCREKINIPILIVCLNITNERIISLIKAGIRGVITNESEFHLIPLAIKAIRNNELWCPRSILQQVFEHYKKGLAGTRILNESHQVLSSRELEILSLIVRGMKNRDISSQLGISYSTVINHTYNIYRKLEVNNRAGAIRFAINNRLVENV